MDGVVLRPSGYRNIVPLDYLGFHVFAWFFVLELVHRHLARKKACPAAGTEGNKKPLRERKGLAPLVARHEPHRPSVRTGFATLPAGVGWRALHRARTLDASRDTQLKLYAGAPRTRLTMHGYGKANPLLGAPSPFAKGRRAARKSRRVRLMRCAPPALLLFCYSLPASARSVSVAARSIVGEVTMGESSVPTSGEKHRSPGRTCAAAGGTRARQCRRSL